jgi:hypothetical protein
MRRAHRLGIAFASWAVAGCLTSIDAAVTEHKGAVTTSLGRVAQVAPALPGLAPLASDEVGPLGPPMKLAMDAGPSSRANAAVVYAEDLERLGELGPVYARIDGSTHPSDCAAFLEHRTYPWDPKKPERWTALLAGFEVESSFELCERLSYVLVVRTLELARASDLRVEGTNPAGPRPELHADETTCGKAELRCVFDSGWLRGEVHVFQLEPFEHRGGFRFEAVNDDKLPWPDAAASVLEKNLSIKVAKAIAEGVRAHVAGATVTGAP